ncbi:tripartite tricarboxylate transporter TctB family protein [Hyphomicrobiales bacterium]|uniref:tripartite tricarboxylate transporter TctB family protein n=1 Tax=Pseudochrobactrum asaccharolyticum TaxID=354351 RepID=UPI000EFAD514
MSEKSVNSKRTGLIYGACLFALAVTYGIMGSRIDYAFASDPLGPRVVPVILAGFLALLCLFYFKNPGEAEGFPKGKTLARVLAVPCTLVIAVLLLETTGFLLAVFLIVTVIAVLFGAPWKYALAGGASQALLWWFVFSYLLEVYLPKGIIFG